MSRVRDRAWADYSERFRREVFPKLASSSVTLAMLGRGDDVDVMQATELGAMLLLDKPIVLVCVQGATIPSRLRRAADVVIEDWSPDNPLAQDQIAAALGRLVSETDGGES